MCWCFFPFFKIRVRRKEFVTSLSFHKQYLKSMNVICAWVKDILCTYRAIVFKYVVQNLGIHFATYVYWTVHHCNSWRTKRPSWCHLLFYFTSYVLNMFRTIIYPSSGACDCAVELPHRSFCSRFVVCWRFGAAGFEYYSNLQHTTNREQNYRCGNSTARSQAPDDGYINVRNMLRT